jgi:hypothetical protein
MELLIKFLKKHFKKKTIYSNVVRFIYKIPQWHGLCDVLVACFVGVEALLCFMWGCGRGKQFALHWGIVQFSPYKLIFFSKMCMLWFDFRLFRNSKNRLGYTIMGLNPFQNKPPNNNNKPANLSWKPSVGRFFIF